MVSVQVRADAFLPGHLLRNKHRCHGRTWMPRASELEESRKTPPHVRVPGYFRPTPPWACYSIKAKPANRLPPTTSSPYAWPNASTWPAELGLPLLDEPSPRPVNTPSVLLAVALTVAEVVLLVLFSSFGLRAPHGWSSRQEEAQALSLPQPATHWLPHSWQTKYGSVREYSVILGCWPLPQRQPYLSVSYRTVSPKFQQESRG